MILLSFIIPLAFTLLGVFYFKKEFKIEEMLILLTVTALTITGTYFVMKNNSLEDVEYNGYFINEARYYEPYETYLRKTCTRQVSSGRDSKGNTTYRTESYDCSYCDEISAKYNLIDTGGNTFSISKYDYDFYVALWKQQPKFNELNRNINYSFGCGEDGDMYSVNWDKSLATSITSTIEVPYDNILQTNKSAFNFVAITKLNAKAKLLYDYPKVDNYRQNTVLGLDSLKLSNQQKTYITKRANYINGMLGSTKFARVYYMIFVDKPVDMTYLQESYWQGGNRNEINVCIGTDKSGNIKWVKSFSWSKNKRVMVDIDNDLIRHKSIKNINAINGDVVNTIRKNYNWRDFKEFNYLDWEPSTKQIIWLYIITFILSGGLFIFFIMNDY